MIHDIAIGLLGALGGQVLALIVFKILRVLRAQRLRNAGLE
ncbi:hypothetical protein AA13595_1299 [Gluconacetobacter johannae DSM 13595]|nr:hypothetical protein [Gluconacetobacter johannae]GBQ84006.1 hypothetical protein AA13595_1299 [Gluconacetobacter johannae DSM 13595]